MSDKIAMPIRYSRGFGKNDNHPQTRCVEDFKAFAHEILRDRSRRKGEAWIAAQFNSDGRRCKENAEPRRFLPVDLDRIDPARLPGRAALVYTLQGLRLSDRAEHTGGAT